MLRSFQTSHGSVELRLSRETVCHHACVSIICHPHYSQVTGESKRKVIKVPIVTLSPKRRSQRVMKG